MTEIEKAQFASDLLNGLSPLMTGCFLLGLIVGVFFFSRLAQTIDRLGYRLRKPSRIRYRNMNGRPERKDNFEYLYLFKGDYYTLEQRDFLIKERLKDIKKFSKFNYSILFFILFIFILSFTAGYFFKPLGI